MRINAPSRDVRGERRCPLLGSFWQGDGNAYANNNQATGSRVHNPGFGTQVSFEAINEPGCYICNWSGHLLRVPADAIQPGRSPLVSMKGIDTPFVTKISNDPFLPVTRARMLTADLDVTVNF